MRKKIKKNFMTNWKKYKLSEISKDISYGYTESASNERIGPKFLRITDIQDYFINWDTVPYCRINDNDFLKYSLKKGDIVIARTGNSTGATAIVKEDIEAVFASYLIRFRINNSYAHSDFISLILKSNLWKEFINSIIGGSAQPGANAKQLSGFEILLPPLHEQQSIASILSSLDDKIELNRRQNETLEKIAQAIFKHWFVDFEFPDANGKPYRSSGGEMQESELGMIPKGWRVGKLGEVMELVYGKGLKEEIRENGEYLVIGSNGIVGKHNEYLVEAPGIVIGRKGTIGEVHWIDKNFYPIDTTFYIRDLLQVEGLYFHYFVLKSEDFKRINSDSAVPGLNRNEAYKNQIIVPNKNIVKLFNKLIASFFEKKKININQNTTLSQLRDSLLPKLMSGKVRVRGDKK
ncbi:MAG: restriction endonuclease subunit S [FCB group bacterium]